MITPMMRLILVGGASLLGLLILGVSRRVCIVLCNAIARGDVNEDGAWETAIDPFVWSAGSVPEARVV